ncbi:ribonuclease P protein component [Treponema brennaborense]|uniref:Ribonuclease P protein component n=1 Tax=Treponema brennaborense (strain DSM 12168 / CIP 105900 / DD5/3) TaxID=906968 RepID=F4LK77_TREBD|nr:ribonuclease P protein component [Treponema brennaborense]AEE15466.1 Ribonuclease P protein component [Treponema brennaborense DSM 12168]
MGTDLVRTGRFTREERIKRSADIQNLFKTGKRVGVSGAKMFVLPNNTDKNRIAFTLPRGYGNAVERNRSKRVSREAYRYFKAFLNTGYDMIFLVYPGNDSFRTRCAQFRYLCQKAGILSL